MTSLFCTFGYLNVEKQKLLLLWMKITIQLANYEVVGLSQNENEEFWRKEKLVYKYFSRSVRIGSFIGNLLVNIQFFFIMFPVPFYWFLIISFIHIALFRYLLD